MPSVLAFHEWKETPDEFDVRNRGNSANRKTCALNAYKHTMYVYMHIHKCVRSVRWSWKNYPEQRLWRNCAQGQRRISFIKMKRPAARCVYSGKLNVNVTVHMCACMSVCACACVCVLLCTRACKPQGRRAAGRDAAALLAMGKSALFVACWFFYACKHDASE